MNYPCSAILEFPTCCNSEFNHSHPKAIADSSELPYPRLNMRFELGKVTNLRSALRAIWKRHRLLILILKPKVVVAPTLGSIKRTHSALTQPARLSATIAYRRFYDQPSCYCACSDAANNQPGLWRDAITCFTNALDFGISNRLCRAVLRIL